MPENSISTPTKARTMRVRDADIDLVCRVLREIHPLPDGAILAISTHMRRLELSAGQFLLRPGDRATHAFIVIQGLLCESHVDRDGRQSLRAFSTEGSLSGSLVDLISGAPAICHIKALEKTVVLSIPWAELDKAGRTDIHWQSLLRRVAERLYVQKVHREHAMLTMTATERLADFRRTFPRLLHRVPKYAIASYLGITAVHLSRLSSTSL